MTACSPKIPLEIIILAAGQGTRMQSTRAKVLHTIGGRAMLDHLLMSCLDLNPSAIHIVVGANKARVIEWVGQWQDSACIAPMPRIQCVEQSKQLGTGHAVMQALNFVGSASRVLVMNGDTPLVLPATLRQVARLQGGLNLMTVTTDTPRAMGRIIRDAAAKVLKIVEFKDATAAEKKVAEVNTNCLCAGASELLMWLQETNSDNAQNEFYLPDVVAVAVAHGETITTVAPSTQTEVYDVNDKQDLARAERIYQQRQVEKILDAGVTVFDPARVDVRGNCSFGCDCSVDINVIFAGAVKIGNEVKIGANTIIRDAVIGDGTTIEANTVIESSRIGKQCNIGPFARIRPESDIDDRVRIGGFVEIKKSRIKQNSVVAHLSYIGDSVVGENVNIGAGVITCNYDGANKHQTVIGDDVFVGAGVKLVAPLKIANGATIGAGSTITDNVESGVLAVGRSRQKSIENWKRPGAKKS